MREKVFCEIDIEIERDRSISIDRLTERGHNNCSCYKKSQTSYERLSLRSLRSHSSLPLPILPTRARYLMCLTWVALSKIDLKPYARLYLVWVPAISR